MAICTAANAITPPALHSFLSPGWTGSVVANFGDGEGGLPNNVQLPSCFSRPVSAVKLLFVWSCQLSCAWRMRLDNCQAYAYKGSIVQSICMKTPDWGDSDSGPPQSRFPSNVERHRHVPFQRFPFPVVWTLFAIHSRMMETSLPCSRTRHAAQRLALVKTNAARVRRKTTSCSQGISERLHGYFPNLAQNCSIRAWTIQQIACVQLLSF